MDFFPHIFRDHFWALNCPGRGADPGNLVENITEDILNSIAIAKAMFCPEYDNSNQDVNKNSEVQQPSSSVTIDKNNYETNLVENITEDVLNSIAIAKAMICPEYENNIQEVNKNSEGQQPSCSVTIEKNNYKNNLAENITEDVLNCIAIAKAMFSPEYDNNPDVNRNSEVQQSSSSVTIDKSNHENNLVENITDVLNSIAIAKAMFCPEYDNNNKDVNVNSEVQQPSCSVTSDKSNHENNLVENITEDVLNSIAIAKAMFFPEDDNNNKDVNVNSEVQHHSSSVTVDKNKFEANFDVQHFKPEEITVKVNDDKSVTIEAKHEEKPEEYGAIYRHLIRKYVLPDNCDIERVESRLSSDGVLTITAAIINENLGEQRTIPITQTGVPVPSQVNST
ncbi:unnamed protein product [Diabrotica balteata]|uniref:SHSP domain-containing protein n=1 Tax=Diabrotica balteata TaxID=107213 RepID=A0A9N9T3B9_DIABA|nr:unnamed protein product [Diabrotica balteata]